MIESKIFKGVKWIDWDNLILEDCPGGVGAIMRACRARDSGSIPGQGVPIGPVAQSGRALGF
ncbi:conserved hypothetical protein [Methanothermobacter sp. MT-2]|nr:conserved hypothetical protein [Methanothermobacter sp. MT-2]